MANSKIIITFDGIPSVNSELNFLESTLNLNLKEKFRPSRLGLYQVKIPAAFDVGTEEEPQIIYDGYISQNYRNAFVLDYNSGALFTVDFTTEIPSTGLGSVTITANYAGAVFSEVDVPGAVTVEIINEDLASPIEINSVTFSPAPSPCDVVRLNIQTSVLATKIISPIAVTGNNLNPFAFDYFRNQTINLIVENAEGTQASQTIVLPSLLNADNFAITLNYGPNGATATATSENTYGLELEYSLDNITRQASEIFRGLEAGDYTLYVRDNLGCSFQKTFSVSEFGIDAPYFYISKSNSIRFANRITWGDSANYKTDENTLACESTVKFPHPELQRFQSADVITTQFKSNYGDISASIVNPDDTVIDVPVVKKTNNIGIKDKRDSRKFNIGNGKTGIYFLSGNVYDYVNESIIEPYALNGYLPVWAVIGNYFEIGGIWYLIDDIFYDEDRSAEVISYLNTYEGAEVNVIVGSIYNLFNYEVYEFKIEMVNFIDEYFQVLITNNDEVFPDLIHLSEKIYVKVKHEDTVEIRYKNQTNNDVYYATGIEHKIRIPITKVSGKYDEESETYKTDTDAKLLKSELYEVDQFDFEPVTKEIMRKMVMALAHDTVLLDGVGYVKNTSTEVEGPLEDSNLYVVKATMIKTGNVYSGNGGSTEFNEGSIEIPGLIRTENGFVSY